jgi:hypothetical protein
MPDRTVPERVLDGRDAPNQVVVELPGAQAELEAVPITVQRHEMTSGLDFSQQRRPTADLLTDHEERGPGARPREALEDGRGALRMGPVIEGQGHAAGAGQRARNAEPVGESRPNRRESVREHAEMIPESGRRVEPRDAT